MPEERPLPVDLPGTGRLSTREKPSSSLPRHLQHGLGLRAYLARFSSAHLCTPVDFVRFSAQALMDRISSQESGLVTSIYI